MTTMHKRKTYKKSKAAKIRKLILEGSLTPTEIADKTRVSINYVYVIKGQMKQDGLVRAQPPANPLAKPVPTSSGKRRVGRPPKRIEPTIAPLSEGFIYIPSQDAPVQIRPKPQNPYGIEATPPIGLWNMFIAKLRRWLAK
jgi:hypothetical protein